MRLTQDSWNCTELRDVHSMQHRDASWRALIHGGHESHNGGLAGIEGLRVGDVHPDEHRWLGAPDGRCLLHAVAEAADAHVLSLIHI